jgi:hypothetical protein
MNKKLLVLFAMMLAAVSSAATGKRPGIEFVIGSLLALQLSHSKVSRILAFQSRRGPNLNLDLTRRRSVGQLRLLLWR